MKFGMIGDSYVARSTSIADEECINLYVETHTTDGTKSLIYTPGLEVFCTFPQGPTRGGIVVGSRLFEVAGGNLYEVTAAGVATSRGTVGNDLNPVSLASNGFQVLVVSAGRAYCYTLATNALLDVTAQLAAIPMQVQYSDSYFVVAFKNSNAFQMSDILDGTVWPGIQVNAVSVFPENITSIVVNHRELWVFGARHAQPYQNTGSVEVFDVIPGSFVETGSAATMGPCLLDNSIFWVSEDERGGRMAWRSNGYTPARVSTHAVEIDLASYPTIAGMTSYAYQDGGHLFWVLYVPGSPWSWVYDVSESLWHKRSSLIQGVPSAHFSWNHVYAFGLHLVGDWNSGNLYAMSQNAFSDNGTEIRRVRRPPTIQDEMEWIRHSELVLDFDMGNLSTVQPTDKPTFAASLYGPKPGTLAANTDTGGAAWNNVNNVLTAGAYADAQLTATVDTRNSSTSTGTTTGGGVAWNNPANIDSTSVYADVTLAAGGPHIVPTDTGSVSNAANPSNQLPKDQTQYMGGFHSQAATDATIYVVVNGSVVASSGGGVLSLYYSQDSGVKWKLAGSNNATFANITVGITLSGLTNLNTIQLKIVASCSCAPTGFANVSITVVRWYAILPGSGQPTSQKLVAAITGLVLPDGVTIKGLGISVDGFYVTDAPTMQVALNVGNLPEAITLSSTPGTYLAGGSTDLWGYDAWDATTLTNLTVSFSGTSPGNTSISLNKLVVTVYFTQTSIPSDAIDITKFGFTVPDTATPKGLIPAVLAYANVDGAQITVQPLKAGFPAGASETLSISTTPAILNFGGIADLFQSTWQDADLRQDTFGLRVTAHTTTGTSIQVFVGYTTLQIYAPATMQSQTYIGPNPNLLDGDGNPRAPQMVVRWSDDRGKTWSNDHVLDCGDLGDYTARAIIRRLGRSRYRVYEIVMTDPVPWVLVEGYLEASK